MATMMKTMIEMNEVIRRLLELPAEIAQAETRLLEMETAHANFAACLQLTEDRLLLTGAIDGKNAEVRSAQLREQTAATRAQVEEAQESAVRMKVALHARQNEFSALKAIARLLASNSD